MPTETGESWAGRSEREILHRAGQGNWGAFRAAGLELSRITDIAESWADPLAGVERPWLCWNVDPDWCLVQQKLVAAVGWTPVIGFDPRVGPPASVLPGSVVVDFNAGIGLPVLYPHFPLEFAFLYCDRLAFWHSDLLVRPPLMASLAERFSDLRQGQTAATRTSPGLRHLFSVGRKRHWELIGCATRAASRDQFERGCGWWMEFWEHPNRPPDQAALADRKRYYWDHGAGIYYWNTRLGGEVVLVDGKVLDEGHFTKIGRKDYKRSVMVGSSDAQRSMSREITDNFDLGDACRRLGLGDLVADQPAR